MPGFTRTVRFRLTLWYSSLLLVFGVAFVVALNLAVRFDHPEGQLYEGIRVDDYEWRPVRNGPGGAVNLVPMLTPGLILKQAEDDAYSANLDSLRTWSLVSIFGLALAAGFGGYVLSGMMLRPVRDITQIASEIGETNLSRRINHQGPDDELKALADTFDSMIERLEQSFERQRQFVQDASHELRTPLAAIRTNIEVAEMESELGADGYRAVLDTVKAQTERLTRLSEDLLLLTTGTRDAVEAEPVDLASLCRGVVRELEPLAAARQVSLVLDVPDGLEAVADGDLLYRAVVNLADNAIKYGGNGGSARLAARREGDRIHLSVSDSGPGIAPEDRERIFDRFYRVDKGRSRREGGTGLGLAIVLELVEGMRGTVSVESEEGRGTTFTIDLPAAVAEPEFDARAGILRSLPFGGTGR